MPSRRTALRATVKKTITGTAGRASRANLTRTNRSADSPRRSAERQPARAA
nr:hypothetical protein [uncultured Microbacterium sp.]